MDKYYFYTGFNKPKQIELESITLDHNYLGDVTSDFLSEQEEHKYESDEDYNSVMGLVYGVYRNPSTNILKQANKRYGLSENDYISDFKE